MLSQTTCPSVPATEVNKIVGTASTSIVPLKLIPEHKPPDVVTVYEYEPETVGVPEIINTPPEKLPETPNGNEPDVINALVAPPPIV